MELNNTPASDDLSIYERERREKREKLRGLGLDPYGGRTEGVRPLAEIKGEYKAEMGHDGGPVVKGAGRVMLKRDMGKLSFLTLRDESGDLQIALDKKRLPEGDWEVNGLIDLGDILLAEGPLGVTKKGEVTVWATHIEVASKALLPPPAKWEGLSDVELRYRQRYVDLWANPEVMKTLKLRMQIVDEVRQYMRGRGFLEVETPMMQTMHGGAAARPFVTKHNALGMDLYMRIAPELYLKRLLVGGFTKVFELNRNFRNEGISPRHNPEFTMIEAYEAFGSFETMADLVEGMICHIAEKLFGGLKIEHKNAAGEVVRTINLTRPWRKVSMVDLVHESCGWRFTKASLADEDRGKIAKGIEILYIRRLGRRIKRVDSFAGELFLKAKDAESASEMASVVINRLRARSASLQDQLSLVKRLIESKTFDIEVVNRELQSLAMQGKIVDEETEEVRRIFASGQIKGEVNAFVNSLVKLSPAECLVALYEKAVEPGLIDPCFVTHVPSVIIPLARKNKDDPFFADVYELAINGQEISPGYSELNDPDVQAENFRHQVGDKEEQQKTDEDFLTALRYGMPPAGGMGLGIDRLVMMLTGAESIRDVILFPLMRPS